tara:strand:+ start:955 stop:1236 length:282 start_codon:yes stop_codon:yes gene_type:complete
MAGNTGNHSGKRMIHEDEGDNRWEYQDKFTYEFTKDDVFLLYHSVCETIRLWPGSPARPVEEQEHLYQLRDSFYVGVLEYKFNNMESDRDQDK